MSKNHAKDFPRREASARETARWLRPSLHRAASGGAQEVSVSIRDLDEILAYMEAAEQKEKVEFAGKCMGFANPDDIRDLRSRKKAFIKVFFKKTNVHVVEACYQELPPKPCSDPPELTVLPPQMAVERLSE